VLSDPTAAVSPAARRPCCSGNARRDRWEEWSQAGPLTPRSPVALPSWATSHEPRVTSHERPTRSSELRASSLFASEREASTADSQRKPIAELAAWRSAPRVDQYRVSGNRGPDALVSPQCSTAAPCAVCLGCGCWCWPTVADAGRQFSVQPCPLQRAGRRSRWLAGSLPAKCWGIPVPHVPIRRVGMARRGRTPGQAPSREATRLRVARNGLLMVPFVPGAPASLSVASTVPSRGAAESAGACCRLGTGQFRITGRITQAAAACMAPFDYSALMLTSETQQARGAGFGTRGHTTTKTSQYAGPLALRLSSGIVDTLASRAPSWPLLLKNTWAGRRSSLDATVRQTHRYPTDNVPHGSPRWAHLTDPLTRRSVDPSRARLLYRLIRIIVTTTTTAIADTTTTTTIIITTTTTTSTTFSTYPPNHGLSK
jgi:hypothetical protein